MALPGGIRADAPEACPDRATGEGRVAVVYSDQSSLEASDSARQERMAAARERGVEFGDALVLEVLYSKLL